MGLQNDGKDEPDNFDEIAEITISPNLRERVALIGFRILTKKIIRKRHFMDNELLQGISLLLDTKLGDIRNDIKDLKDDVKSLKSEMTDVKDRLADVERETRKANMIIENEIRRDIGLLKEAQSEIFNKVKYLPEEVEDVKESVSILKFVQAEMAKKPNK